MSDLAAQRRFGEQVARRVEEARRDLLPRLFAKDASLWVAEEREQAEVRDRLGWLELPVAMAPRLAEVEAFVAEVRAAGLRRVVLLGMGGSSLAPDVFSRILGVGPGGLPLTVLDSTDPAAVLAAEAGGEPSTTLFIIASKSGGTVEPNAMLAYFLERTGGKGAQFVAITDPGTSLERLARAKGFRHTFLNPADVGGRYSALSLFGLVPAALLGVDIRRVLASAGRARAGCADGDGVAGKFAARLGALLATAAESGRDKLTFLMPRALEPFGAWVEQLVAESTGKGGKGILPVVGEPVRAPEAYGSDRVFFGVLSPGDEATREQEMEVLSALAKAGHPGIGLPFDPAADLGGAFFEWEVATALAGVWLRINPFDQPNVAESKANTDSVLAQTVAGGEPWQKTATADRAALAAQLRPWRERIRPGGYVALLAYLAPTPAHDAALGRLRAAIGAATGAAVTVGYGPRYLHSTGQLHKGGPATGSFLLLDAEGARDVAVPGAAYTFGRLERAQALGDFFALQVRGRNVLALRLSEGGLPVLEAALADALGRA